MTHLQVKRRFRNGLESCLTRISSMGMECQQSTHHDDFPKKDVQGRHWSRGKQTNCPGRLFHYSLTTNRQFQPVPQQVESVQQTSATHRLLHHHQHHHNHVIWIWVSSLAASNLTCLQRGWNMLEICECHDTTKTKRVDSMCFDPKPTPSMYLRPTCCTSSSLCWLVLPSWSQWSANSAGYGTWMNIAPWRIDFKKLGCFPWLYSII